MSLMSVSLISELSAMSQTKLPRISHAGHRSHIKYVHAQDTLYEKGKAIHGKKETNKELGGFMKYKLYGLWLDKN